MVIRIALLLLGIPLLVHGAEGLYHVLRSRAQTEVTCEQFHRDRPASGWLRITGCEIDYVRAGYRDARGRVTELFFPVRPAGTSPAQPSSLVIATRDPGLLALIERGLAGPAQKDQEAFLVMMLQIVTAMGASREVEGLTRPPLAALISRPSLRSIKAPLESEFAILDLRRRPQPLFPAIEAIVGAVALFLVAVLSTTRQRNGKPAMAPAPEVDAAIATAPAADAAIAATPPSAQGDDRRYRRLMLVNLPPHSLPVALEGAPPLGQQPAVRSALTRVLPGISFDAAGVGQFNRPDHCIRVDIGSAPEVWTAAIDVTGDAAAAALKRLVTQTGWQAYAPRLGRFLTSDDF